MNTMMRFKSTCCWRNVRAAREFAMMEFINTRCSFANSVKLGSMIPESIFRIRNIVALIFVTRKVTKPVLVDHMLDKCFWFHVGSKFTVKIVPSAVKLLIFLYFPMEGSTIFIEKRKMFFRQADFLRELFKGFRNFDYKIIYFSLSFSFKPFISFFLLFFGFWTSMSISGSFRFGGLSITKLRAVLDCRFLDRLSSNA